MASTDWDRLPKERRDERREAEIMARSMGQLPTPDKPLDLNRAAMKQVQERKYAPSESGIQGERIVIIFRLTD